MAPVSITIVLELQETADAPVGSARLPDGTSRTFHGWLGLAEAIDALAGMRGPRAATSTSTPPPEQDNRSTKWHTDDRT